MSQDYVGSSNARDKDVVHFGVPGMKWGVRKGSSGGGGSSSGAKPTRARAKEEHAKAVAKQGSALDARIAKLKDGSGRPLVVKGKKLSTQESIDHLANQKKKLGIKDDKTAKTKEEARPKEGDAAGNLYNALKAKALKDGVNSLSDDELKYLNGRNEALSKAQKLVQTPDSWLAKTIKDSLTKVLNKGLDEGLKVAGAKIKEKLDAEPTTGGSKSSSTSSSSSKSPGSGKTRSQPFRTSSPKFKYSVFVGNPRTNAFRAKPMITAGPRALEGPVYKVTTL